MGKVTDKHGKRLVAYSVQGYEYGCIVFASNSATARRNGASELGCDWEDIETCRRAPALDKYAAQRRVPWKVLVEEHGWSQECGYCQCHVYNDEPDRVWNDTGEQIYCDAECEARAEDLKRKYEQDRQREEQLKAEAVEAARQRFEGVTEFHAHMNGGTVQVCFRFPGSQWNATWTVGDELVRVSQCDVEAWKAYRAPYQNAEASA